MREVTPPALQGPTPKERKYDRQLRLWAASGQQALEEAHVLLINAGPGVVGIETLKNLVLPGMGHFTVLDSSLVTEADLGVNFFLEDASIGGYRAEHCCHLLKELNPDVQGNYIAEPLETFLTKPRALEPYTLILVTAPVAPEILETLSEHAQTNAVPLFYIHCVGFYSHFSLVLPSAFPIVDTHPEPTSTTDLRLLNPWPALSELSAEKTKHLEGLDNDEHGHIPYLLLLLHYIEEWKRAHDAQLPISFEEKSAFRELVRSGARTDIPEGGEENYDEAVAAVIKSLVPPSVNSGTREVFEAEECRNINRESANFWIIAHAIDTFSRGHSVLPLSGSLPDMKAQSKDYVALQNVYKAKAREDVAEVLRTVRKLERKFGRETQIEEKEVEAFCKGAGFIRILRGRPFHITKPNQLVKWGDRAKFAASSLSNADSLILLYIGFLAFDSFAASHAVDDQLSKAQVPGLQDVEADEVKMSGMVHAIIDDLLKEAGEFIEDPEYSEIKTKAADIAREIVRAGGGELHNTSALTGGMVAQEVIKVITKQYIPVDNTCLFDGIESKSAVLRL